MSLPFKEVKPFLGDYLGTHLEPSPRAGAGFFVCPLCGSGTGKNQTGAFHHERGSESWKCFTCSEGGDLVDLHGKLQGLSDVEAVKDLAGMYGIQIEDTAPSSRQPKSLDELMSPASERRTAPVDKPVGESKPVPVAAPVGPVDAAKPAPSVDYGPWLEACRETSPLDSHGPAKAYLEARGIPLEAASAAGVTVWDGWDNQRAAWPREAGRLPRFLPALIIPYEGGRYWQARNLNAGAEDRWDKPLADMAGPDPLLGSWTLEDPEDRRPLVIVEGPGDYLAVTAAGGRALALGTAKSRKIAGLVEKLGAGVPVIEALDQDERGRDGAGDLREALPSSRPLVSLWDFVEHGVKDPAELAGVDAGALQRALQRAQDAPGRALAASSVGNTLDGFLKRNTQRAGQSRTPTGFKSLDAALEGGLQPGLTIIGALSSLGKTTFALQVADTVAASGNRPVIVFSLEQGRDELIAKSLSRISREESGDNGVNALKARGLASMSLSEEAALTGAVETYRERTKNLWIYEGVGDLGVKDIRGTVEAHAATFPQLEPPLVVIDYLQVLAPESDRFSDKQATDKAVTALKQLSRDTGAPVLVVSSLNRASYSGPITMSAFKESGAIEYGSDLLLGIQAAGLQDGESAGALAANNRAVKEHRRALERDVEVVVLKNRNGPTSAVVPLMFEPVFSRFVDRDSNDVWKRKTTKRGL